MMYDGMISFKHVRNVCSEKKKKGKLILNKCLRVATENMSSTVPEMGISYHIFLFYVVLVRPLTSL